MDKYQALVAIAAVIGGTVMVSTIVMAITQIVTARRRQAVDSTDHGAIEERLIRIEQAIDAMATEVERVSEGQRFTSRLLADREQQRT